MKNFDEVLIAEPELVAFLRRTDFFDKPYFGDDRNFLIVKSPESADEFFHKVTDRGDWSDIQNSNCGQIDEFPSSEFVERNFDFVTDCLDAQVKNFHHATEAAENLTDNMASDFCRMFDFACMEMEFPPVWKLIKYAYLHSGWPCGWDGEYPEGRMVIYSSATAWIR